MATAFKSLDTTIPFTPSPKPIIRVAWSQGAAAQAIATKLAGTPVSEATLEELQIADLTRGVIATARRLLSPRMYAAFLRWGEAATPFASQNEEEDEELASEQCEANSTSVATLAETPTCNEHDVGLKHYILALENTGSSPLGPVITDNYRDVSGSGEALTRGLGADLIGTAPLSLEIDRMTRHAVDWSNGNMTYAPGIGQAITAVFTEARRLLEDEGETADTRPPDMTGYDRWMRGPLIAWNRQYDRVLMAEAELVAFDRDVHAPVFAEGANERDDVRSGVQHCYDQLATAMYDELQRLWLLPAPGPSELAIKLKLLRDHGGMAQGDADAYVDALTIDARRFGRHGAFLQTDQKLLDAFAASRKAEVAVMHEPRPLCGDRFSEHFEETAAAEEVIFSSCATTIEGVLAKLRVGFAHGLDGNRWRADAIIDPRSARFREGIADDDYFARMLWSGIEDLARIGGVNLSEQGR